MFSQARAHVADAPGLAEGGSAGSRILVVDDNADAAASLATLLELQGHEGRTATDGVLAVEKAQLFAPDTVLMDLAMPRLDGFEAARRIRASALGESVRIVALTGWGQEADRRRTRDTLADTAQGKLATGMSSSHADTQPM